MVTDQVRATNTRFSTRDKPGRNRGSDVEVGLDAHDDRLRLAAAVNHEPLIFLFDATNDLPELGPSGHSGHDVG